MPSLGPAEILVILVIALLVFGPNKMPEIARQVGRGMREFRRVQQHLTTELRDVVSEFDGSNDATSAASAPPSGDPVPTLPPHADADGSAVDAAAGDGGAPDAPSGPHDSTDTLRGQRVWQPPTPPAV